MQSYRRMEELAQPTKHVLCEQKVLSLTQVEMGTRVIPALKTRKLKDSLRLIGQPV